jgi:superfamily I DNA/RNA helicase
VPEIILGPPGTGKTTTLINMVQEELARGVSPDRIGYVSFTKRAAREASRRAEERFSLRAADLPHFRTLHSLCFRQLGLSASDVLQGNRLAELGDLAGVRISEYTQFDEESVFGYERGDRMLFMENLARVNCVSLRQQYDLDTDDIDWWEIERFARTLREYKDDRGLVDYTDMLVQYAASSAGIGLEVLFVDEAQDLSQLQWRVVEKLMVGCRRVVIAGDDDQAIYRWAGADVDHLIQMQGDARVLGQSWRVPRTVQTAASRIISQVRSRRPKDWMPRDHEGAVSHVASFDEIDLSTGKDILILGRNRKMIEEATSVVRSHGFYYDCMGKQAVKPSVLRAVLTWERLRQRSTTPVTTEDALVMYDLMTSGRTVKRGHKKLPGFEQGQVITIDDLVQRGGLMADPSKLWYDALDAMTMVDIAYIRAARRRGEDFRVSPRIRLSTIHGMKGGEGEHVVLLTDMAKRTHQEMSRNPDDEARVWYVAVTRTRDRLSIVAPRTPRNYDSANF